MMIVRPVRADDLPAVVALAESASIGLTTLPPDRRLLDRRIRASINAFAADVERPAGEAYLFVMEDLTTGQLRGTCGVVARVGGFEPFYSYAVKTHVHASKQLHASKDIGVLHLVQNHKGPTEIGTLFVHKDARGGGAGRLVSLSRFLFIAAFPHRFDEQVIAEMRGVVTAQGQSPFWNAIGRHFFAMEFAQADVLSATDKQFIGELMPKHPLYIPMLPPEAQSVIGQVHDETRPALRLLEQEGFRYNHQVDIFDGGPMVEAGLREIRSIRESRRATVGRIVPTSGVDAPMIIANERLDFRCCLGSVEVTGDGLVDLPRDVALALGVRLGDAVRYVSARPAVGQSA
jgi:arginine N-succinyltransferase